jgi:hypothetical protein
MKPCRLISIKLTLIKKWWTGYFVIVPEFQVCMILCSKSRHIRYFWLHRKWFLFLYFTIITSILHKTTKPFEYLHLTASYVFSNWTRRVSYFIKQHEKLMPWTDFITCDEWHYILITQCWLWKYWNRFQCIY